MKGKDIMERLIKHANLYFTTKDINTKQFNECLSASLLPTTVKGARERHDVKLVQ